MIQEYILLSTVLLICIVCFIGSLLNWKWLVDPPEEFHWCYSQSFLKYYFGADFTKTTTIIFSVLGSIFAGWFILFLIDIQILLCIYYILILLTVCMLGFNFIKKAIKQLIIDKTPLPNYFETKEGNIICNKCGYKQSANSLCINCGQHFLLEKKEEI